MQECRAVRILLQTFYLNDIILAYLRSEGMLKL